MSGWLLLSCAKGPSAPGFLGQKRCSSAFSLPAGKASSVSAGHHVRCEEHLSELDGHIWLCGGEPRVLGATTSHLRGQVCGRVLCPVSELSQQLPKPICDLFTALCFSCLARTAGGSVVLIGEAFAQLLRYLITAECAANIPKTEHPQDKPTSRLLAVPVASRRVTFCLSCRLQMEEKRLVCRLSGTLGGSRC